MQDNNLIKFTRLFYFIGLALGLVSCIVFTILENINLQTFVICIFIMPLVTTILSMIGTLIGFIMDKIKNLLYDDKKSKVLKNSTIITIVLSIFLITKMNKPSIGLGGILIYFIFIIVLVIVLIIYLVLITSIVLQGINKKV